MDENASHSRSPEKPLSNAVQERKYRKPPVVEALCEVYFSDSKWDDTIPGAFYERVKVDFPEKKQRQIQEAQIALGRGAASAGVQTLPPWMQFVTEEGDRMIQIAENLLVVNQLCPYPHFEEWEPIVYRALGIYNELTQPQTATQVGLRYINRIQIPGTKITMGEYFTIYPQLPNPLGNTHGPFLVRVEVPQGEHGHTVLITFGTDVTPSRQGESQVFMLDIYDIIKLEIGPTELELREKVQQAHENAVKAFEGSITDKLRGLLEVED